MRFLSSVFYLIFLSGQTAFSQIHFSGRVITADSVPVLNAFVTLRPADGLSQELGTLTDQFGNFSFTLVTGIHTIEPAIDFALHQNYPNPFTGGTTIPFELRTGTVVRMDIVDVLGRKVRRLLEDYREAGKNFIVWDGKDDKGLPTVSGMYFVVFTCGNKREISKIQRGNGFCGAAPGHGRRGNGQPLWLTIWRPYI